MKSQKKFTEFNTYNVFTFVNIMSLILQCVNFQVSIVYSFVGPYSLKGFWVHCMDNRTRLDGRGTVDPCWDLDLVDIT